MLTYVNSSARNPSLYAYRPFVIVFNTYSNLPMDINEHWHALSPFLTKKGCNLMWGFPTRICPANIVLTSVVSVVLQHRIFLYRLAGSVGASSKRLSWTTKFWSSQIFIACAPLDTTICLAPPHSISNPRCLVVLWVFAAPMSGSNQFYGTDVVSHFHQNLVSSVVPCALANPTTNSIQSGGQIRGQHRIKPIRLCTPMQLQNVQNRFVWVMVAIIVWNLQIKIFRQICEAITSNTNVQMYILKSPLTTMVPHCFRASPYTHVSWS